MENEFVYTSADSKYDSEPVCYCANCYSLKIKREESTGLDYCANCNSLNILEAPISVWERLYESRYGKRFISFKCNPKISYINSLPIDSLKAKLYENPYLKKIIYALYPKFPKYNKAEAVNELLKRATKDGKLNELKLEISKYIKL